jgi:hypothetical protein
MYRQLLMKHIMIKAPDILGIKCFFIEWFSIINVIVKSKFAEETINRSKHKI